MFDLSAVDVICPTCKAVNKSLDLEETDGWMECESCGEVTQQMQYRPALWLLSQGGAEIPFIGRKKASRVRIHLSKTQIHLFRTL